LIVARDIAHAKIKKLLDAGKPMPEYFKTIQFIMLVPKTPDRMPSGSFWTNYCCSRMDVYVEEFQNRAEA
jgi:fumarate hydratase class I